MFRINLENLIQNKIYIAKEYHIQPSEVDRLPFFEYEIYLEQMNIIAKQQEEENKRQREDMDSMKSSMNPAKMMSQMKANSPIQTPKMPSLSSSMPTLPKISIPRM